jgi:hypothetical protein
VHRIIVGGAIAVAALVVSAGTSFACGSLVSPNGAVDLERTTTLAAYHNGLEHYITTFKFEGKEPSFGSIVPLPGRPSKVERGGDWTLQRLVREVSPPVLLDAARTKAVQATGSGVEILDKTRIDSLDITILRGGGRAVAKWAKSQGFALTKDTPDVLEFYSRRSPYFMAAKFDASAAIKQGLDRGQGTPVHLTIPLDRPWVPLRILSTAMPKDYPVKADVFLLTDSKPSLLFGNGFSVERSSVASTSLLNDLRADKGMSWVPGRMWLTYGRVDARAVDVRLDLAVGLGGHDPNPVDLGLPASVSSLLGMD